MLLGRAAQLRARKGAGFAHNLRLHGGVAVPVAAVVVAVQVVPAAIVTVAGAGAVRARGRPLQPGDAQLREPLRDDRLDLGDGLRAALAYRRRRVPGSGNHGIAIARATRPPDRHGHRYRGA